MLVVVSQRDMLIKDEEDARQETEEVRKEGIRLRDLLEEQMREKMKKVKEMVATELGCHETNEGGNCDDLYGNTGKAEEKMKVETIEEEVAFVLKQAKNRMEELETTMNAIREEAANRKAKSVEVVITGEKEDDRMECKDEAEFDRCVSVDSINNHNI